MPEALLGQIKNIGQTFTGNLSQFRMKNIYITFKLTFSSVLRPYSKLLMVPESLTESVDQGEMWPASFKFIFMILENC